ncbi:hypothetical protein Hte_004463 [Hypoxylon texense]
MSDRDKESIMTVSDSSRVTLSDFSNSKRISASDVPDYQPFAPQRLTCEHLFAANRTVFTGQHDVIVPEVAEALRQQFSGIHSPFDYDPFQNQLGIILAGKIPICIDIEMLKPVPQLFHQFVSDSLEDGGFRRLVEVYPDDAEAIKIVLIAVYGGMGGCITLDDEQYSGQDYIRAMRLLHMYEADPWVRSLVSTYFKTYCYRVRIVAPLLPLRKHYGPHCQDSILEQIEECLTMFSLSVPEVFMAIPQWAFGYWALRTIDCDHLYHRMPTLSAHLRDMVAEAARICILRRRNGEQEDEDVIFIPDEAGGD